MDWSKSKNILIIALIITNLVLGVRYIRGEITKKDQAAEAAQTAVEYLNSRGVDIQVELDSQTSKMPVLFVKLERSDASGEELSYENYKLMISGRGDITAQPTGFGESKAETISNASAALKLLSLCFRTDGLQIQQAELVYWLDLSQYGAALGEDTAVPAWMFTTNQGVFYVDAYK